LRVSLFCLRVEVIYGEAMAESLKVQFNRDPRVNQPKFEAEFAEAPAFVVSPFQRLDNSGAELATQQPKSSIHLDLEQLECYEVVAQQFQHCGVTFSNAIALQPSNPAYPASSGTTVLMGSPKNGWVEATFESPVQFVSGFVTSSRRAILSAFDANNQPIGRSESPGANLAGSSSSTPPNVQLSLRAPNIRRVRFHAFDGQLTLDDFSFSF
jgi:hypothetical protein